MQTLSFFLGFGWAAMACAWGPEVLFEAHFLSWFLALLGGLLGASWAILAPKRVPDGAQKGAQSVKKVVSSGLLLLVLFLERFFDEKYIFFIRFLMVFRCIVWPMEEGNAWAQRSKNLKIRRRVSSKTRSSIFLNRVNACRNLEFLVNKWSKDSEHRIQIWARKSIQKSTKNRQKSF